MRDEIDLDRLYAILDAGVEAQAKARGMADQAEELRETLRKLKLGAEAGKVMHHRREERDPQTMRNIAALEEQRDRLEQRRQEALPVLHQRIALARACLAFAKLNHFEVGPGYANI